MKQRLDQLLHARGLVASRSQAESWIRLGKVFVNGQQVTKAGTFVHDDAELELKTTEQYVSRAGLKLASVAQALGLDFRGKVMLDVGSSTGGFTDYALQHGARKVIAVDVGTDQLHPSLQGDPRIELYEQTDIRSMRPATTTTGERAGLLVAGDSTEAQPEKNSGDLRLRDSFTARERSLDVSNPVKPRTDRAMSEVPDIVVLDVSFISLRDILPHVATLCSPQTQIIAMVKPQFEAVASHLKHKGVIKNDRVRREILKDFETWSRTHFVIADKADSDIAGGKGNVERFYKMRRV